MTRDEIVTLLLARLERRENDTYLQSMIPLEMKLVQEALELKEPHPWFLMTEDATTDTVALEDRVPEPAGFLNMDEEQGLYILLPDSTDYVKLQKRDFDFLQAKYGDTPGQPWGYAVEDGQFRLRPIPLTVYPLRFKFFKRDSWPAGSGTNKWMTNAPHLILNATGAVMAGEYLHNDALMQKFAGVAQSAWNDLVVATEQRMHSNRDYNMGEPE